MGQQLQNYKTYYTIQKIGSGVASWDNFKQIKEWGRCHGFESFVKNGRLFLIKEDEIVIYERKHLTK